MPRQKKDSSRLLAIGLVVIVVAGAGWFLMSSSKAPQPVAVQASGATPSTPDPVAQRHPTGSAPNEGDGRLVSPEPSETTAESAPPPAVRQARPRPERGRREAEPTREVEEEKAVAPTQKKKRVFGR